MPSYRPTRSDPVDGNNMSKKNVKQKDTKTNVFQNPREKSAKACCSLPNKKVFIGIQTNIVGIFRLLLNKQKNMKYPWNRRKEREFILQKTYPQQFSNGTGTRKLDSEKQREFRKLFC